MHVKGGIEGEMLHLPRKLLLSLLLTLGLFIVSCHKRSMGGGSSKNEAGAELNNPEIDPDESDGIFVGNGHSEGVDHKGFFLTSCQLEDQNIAICDLNSEYEGDIDLSLVNIVDDNGVVISADDLQIEFIGQDSNSQIKITAKEDIKIKSVLDSSNDQPVSLEKKKSSLGLSLAEVDEGSTQFPFLNLAKSARMWASQMPGMGWEDGSGLDLDENGYIRSLEVDQKAHLVFHILAEDYPVPFERLVVRYDGQGSISYDGFTKDEENSSDGKHILTLSSDAEKKNLVLTISSTNPDDYIRNISIVPEKYLDLYDKGEFFNPVWIEKIKVFKLFKFTEWMATDSSPLEKWEQRPVPSQLSFAFAPPGKSRGVPLELMVKLANRTNTDPWFNMPHLADSHFMSQFAQLVKESLNTNLTVYLEHSSHAWNRFSAQGSYGESAAIDRWGEVEHPQVQWHGMRTTQMCATWKSEWGADSLRVHCTLGTDRNWRNQEELALNCPSWVAEGHEACSHNIDSIGIDGHFDGYLHGGWDSDYTEAIRAWFSDADGGLSKAYEQLTDGRHLSEKGSLKELQDDYTHFKDVADRFGLELVAFSGGSQIRNAGTPVKDDNDFINFHLAVNRGEGIYNIISNNFDAWRDAGGSLFVHSVDISRAANSAHLGALEYLQQSSSPQWRAITDFNKDHECWWDRCK